MTNTKNSTPRKPLRLWPGIVAAALVVLVKLGAPLVLADGAVYGIIAGVAGAAIVAVWWLFFSRAPWIERIGAIVVTAIAYFALKPLLHPSISGGLMGRMFAVYAIPATLVPAFVVWAAATRTLSDGVRRATMVAAILLGCGVWMLLRTEGVKGDAIAQLNWRWTPTAEERLLAQGDDTPKTVPPPPAAPPAAEAPRDTPAAAKEPAQPVESFPTETATAAAVTSPAAGGAATPEPRPASTEAGSRRAEWPGFRGPERDAVIRGVQIATDWSTSPPVELWRRPIGPGWSSFAVDGDRFYTQEQRGDEEVVSCYRISDGEPVWRHRDPVRFYESNGGPGPRATPTVHNGRVYTLGATGVVNALDARTGAAVWSRNAKEDTGAPLPGWGFAGSPLVVEDLVVVATSGRLVGYDIATGHPRWTRRTGGTGYSSPHLVTIDGVAQIVLLNGGATSVSPADGSVLWEQKPRDSAAGIVQPAFTPNGDILVAGADMMGGQGIRRLAVSRKGGAWTVEERWTSRGLKPYFNDFVLHNGHAFGFDGTILACIDLEDGTRKWKGGRYGQGQMLLLRDQDLLLVLSEDGELALVKATPDNYTEVAKFSALEGKTWNHPVVIGDLLLVRNGEQMAAFRLPRASTTE